MEPNVVVGVDADDGGGSSLVDLGCLGATTVVIVCSSQYWLAFAVVAVGDDADGDGVAALSLTSLPLKLSLR